MQNNKILLWLFLIVVLQIMFCGTASEEEGLMINFQPEGKTLEEILTMIKASGKTGMLFFTADWCGPCNSLIKQVFKDEKAGEYIESNFIPFWIEFEKSTSTALAKHYNIRGLPTVVLINTDGEVIDKLGGYSSGPPEKYIERLNKSIEAGNSILELKAEYEANPENIEKALRFADKMMFADNMNYALPIYEDLKDKVKDDSLRSQIYSYLAAGYERNDNLNKAIEVLENGLDKRVFKDEKDIIYCKLGNLFYRRGRLKQSNNLQTYNVDYASATKYYEMLPKELEDFKLYNKSIDYKRRINFEFSRARLNFPAAYFSAGYKQKGTALFEKMFSEAYEKKNYSKISSLLYRCEYNEIYLNEAIPWGEKAVDLSEWKDMSVLLFYSKVLGKAGCYDKAIEVQKKLIDILDPKADKEPHLSYLAVLYLQAGEKEKGKELFEKLYQEAQDDIDKLRDLAWFCQKYNVNLKEAQAWAERAVKLSRDENNAASSRLLSLFP